MFYACDIVYYGPLCCRDMSVNIGEENSVEMIEPTALDGSVISLINDDNAFGTFEIKHDLLLESTVNVAPTGVVPVMQYCVISLSG